MKMKTRIGKMQSRGARGAHTLRSLEAEKGCLGNEASDARWLPSGFASDPRAAAPEFRSFGGCTPQTGMFQMNRELPLLIENEEDHLLNSVTTSFPEIGV